MRKTFVVTRGTDRERLLGALRELGVVHLTPVDPAAAVADERTLAAIGQLDRAVQILSRVEPAGGQPDLPTVAAAAETLDRERKSIEWKSRLATMHRQIEQLEVWGDVRLEQFEQLRRTGIDIRFFSVPSGSIGEVEADCVEVIRELPGKRSLVAAVTRGEEPEVPEGTTAVELPPRDRPSMRQEAAEIDRSLADAAARQARLARLLPAMRKERAALAERAQYTVALRGGLADEHLFGVQGWAPRHKADSLAARLAEMHVSAAVQNAAPTEEDQPPTLIEYPRWVRPIKGLFDILGTVPGYREIDISAFFMIALPIFSAMLIGDAGYGLILLLVPLVWYRRATEAMGKPTVHLVMVLGGATLVWGLLAGNLFGLAPQDLLASGGVWGVVGGALKPLQLIGGDMMAQAQTIMKLSFLLAAIHLSLGQLRQALALVPDLRAVEKVGWALFLWGIFCLIWYLFFGSRQTPKVPPHWLTPWLLGAGAAMAILFAHPSRNPFKRVGIGLASFPLSAVGAFSDSISYIRLMGVGLASTVIGQTFDNLGVQVAAGATWFVGAFVVLFGHALNLGLCMIAVLAHGVRLNMLEFSSHVGIQWAGHPYEPFAKVQRKER